MHDHAPTLSLDGLPQALRAGVARDWQRFVEAALADALSPARFADPQLRLAQVWACSDFVAQSCIRQPRLLQELVGQGALLRRYADGELSARVAEVVARAQDEAALAVGLRRLRRREMVRIAWRDLAGWSDLTETVGELSALAEACIDAALARLDGWQRETFGSPFDAAGERQQLVVIGMGKLGAWELNFSSDIDLIFAYPDAGETRGGRRTLSNEEYFARLGRRLLQTLSDLTVEGFVFRVDLRLRPFGDSGPLAMSFDAMENYYQVHGREWERYAWIKARVVGGDRAAGARLMSTLQPFVYRRYLDFGAFESLREMKTMIAKEVRRKGMEANIKLGLGGIREVEFIGQAFQLIRGGREPALRERRILAVLAQLQTAAYLPEYVVRELCEAYEFLRRAEHRLQEYADQQTHNLPDDAVGQARLAYGMGYADWPGFTGALARHRARVHSHFEQVFEAPQADQAAEGPSDLQALWAGSIEDEQACAVLAARGFGQPAETLQRLRTLQAGHSYRALSASGRERMDKLLPLLIGAAGHAPDPDAALQRLSTLVESIARRTAYIALLVENPVALSQLTRLCGASPWLAKLLARHPLLLDELLDARTLYRTPGREALQSELREALSQVAAEDLEQQMEVLRHFKQSNVLRVAAADLAEVLPIMKVSDHLTWIAEAVLAQVLELAWSHLVARHGTPFAGVDRGAAARGFAVVGYGKLGGLELGYGSDLDLVFLHAGETGDVSTDGPKPVPVSVFFARLGQRIIHMLTAHTPAGVLYEVDMRLRPSGAAGLLVSSMMALAEYQRTQAWTWEHQALVRARVVAGDAGIGAQFDALRREVLARPRVPDAVRREVREMRERMLQAQPARAGVFDLKHDRGGIADIEFMVQYGVLAYAGDHPALLTYTDNVRLLAGLADAGVLTPDDANLLAEAYRAYRTKVHRLSLQEQPAETGEEEFSRLRAEVMRVWRLLMEAEA